MLRRKMAHHGTHHGFRRSMWYVYGTAGGKMYVYGGFSDENEALNKGHAAKDWDSEPDFIQLPTSDLTAAKAMIKAKLVEKSGSLFLSTKRIYKGGNE